MSPSAMLPVLVELGRPPEHGERGRDGEESAVPGTPGLAPVANEAAQIDRREPTEQCNPWPFVHASSFLGRGLLVYNNIYR